MEPENQPGHIEVLNRGSVKAPILEELPAALVTEQSIRWSYTSSKSTTVRLELRYFTKSITWSSDYFIEMNGDLADLTGRYVVHNNSGQNYRYDSLTLVAGEVHLAGDRRRVDRENPLPGASENHPGTEFGEVRRWVIPSPGYLYSAHATILPAFHLDEIVVSRKYVYDASIFNDRITGYLQFVLNAEDAVPLPEGTVRVLRRGLEGESIFIGEDTIDDTPAGSPLELALVQVFDLTAERTRIEEGPLPDGGTMQRWKVTMGNSGGKSVEIEVLERLFGAWTVPAASLDGVVISPAVRDARTAKFNVPLNPGETKRLEYEIHYRR